MAPPRTPIVLASRSPQRRAILTQLGIPFVACPADVEELADGDPTELAVANARRKATALAGDARVAAGATVLGVDTVVVFDGRVYGKPADAAAARATLTALGGRSHQVVSGICAIGPDGEPQTAAATTEVTFRPLDGALVDWYVGTGEWEGRAGGYAIQGRGAALVARIDGDYLNVVGLPVAALLDLLPAIVQRSA